RFCPIAATLPPAMARRSSHESRMSNMISPRNRTDHVTAPVLFRLPHLHARDAADYVEQLPQQPPQADAESTSGVRPAERSATLPQAADVRFQSLSGAMLARRVVLANPSVMFGAMLVVAVGSWIARRQMSAGPAVDVAVAESPAAVSN